MRTVAAFALVVGCAAVVACVACVPTPRGALGLRCADGNDCGTPLVCSAGVCVDPSIAGEGEGEGAEGEGAEGEGEGAEGEGEGAEGEGEGAEGEGGEGEGEGAVAINHAPRAWSTVLVVETNQPYNGVVLTGSDADGDVVTPSIAVGPAECSTFNMSPDATLNLVCSASTSFNFTVADPAGLTGGGSVAIVIINPAGLNTFTGDGDFDDVQRWSAGRPPGAGEQFVIGRAAHAQMSVNHDDVLFNDTIVETGAELDVLGNTLHVQAALVGGNLHGTSGTVLLIDTNAAAGVGTGGALPKTTIIGAAFSVTQPILAARLEIENDFTIASAAVTVTDTLRVSNSGGVLHQTGGLILVEREARFDQGSVTSNLTGGTLVVRNRIESSGTGISGGGTHTVILEPSTAANIDVLGGTHFQNLTIAAHDATAAANFVVNGTLNVARQASLGMTTVEVDGNLILEAQATLAGDALRLTGGLGIDPAAVYDVTDLQIAANQTWPEELEVQNVEIIETGAGDTMLMDADTDRAGNVVIDVNAGLDLANNVLIVDGFENHGTLVMNDVGALLEVFGPVSTFDGNLDLTHGRVIVHGGTLNWSGVDDEVYGRGDFAWQLEGGVDPAPALAVFASGLPSAQVSNIVLGAGATTFTGVVTVNGDLTVASDADVSFSFITVVGNITLAASAQYICTGGFDSVQYQGTCTDALAASRCSTPTGGTICP